MLTRLSEPARDTYSTPFEFREAARPCTHAVTIVRCHRGGRYVQTVVFSACQATAGATNVERSCSRGPDELLLSIPRLRRCGTGRWRPTGRSIQRYRSLMSTRMYNILWCGEGVNGNARY